MAEAYWFESDFQVFKGDDLTITHVFKTLAGSPIDISTWTFTWEANEKSDAGSTQIQIPDGSMTKSSSGQGVTDTMVYTITTALTASANVGRYGYQTKASIAGDVTTYNTGTMTLQPSEF